MQKNINDKNFPFTSQHLQEFKKELEKAGSFDLLMQVKGAIGEEMGEPYFTICMDIEGYKRKHLTGVYKSLRPFYDTEMPFVFWNGLYEIIKS